MKNFDITRLVRDNILKLNPYSSARDEYSGDSGIFLDANENPFGELNRYPDPHQKALKQKLSEVKNIPIEQIFLGNGSDEVIDLAFRIFCRPKIDKVLIFPPTYGMYEVSANINDVEVLSCPLNSDFQIEKNSVLSFLENEDLKMIFICSPNNPTGNNIENIEFIIENFNGIVFVDEAYIDFSKKNSLIEKLNKYSNLIVSQTFSKAMGLAAVRVGVAYSSKEIISIFSKTKPPYNISKLNQQEAFNSLINKEKYHNEVKEILSERIKLEKEFLNISVVKKIYPSDSNFILVEMNNADKIYTDLINKKIITRNRSSIIENCIRITVGTQEENNKLLEELRKNV